MPILNEDRQDVPVTVTLKAETMMQIMVASVGLPQIHSAEVVKIKDALTTALKI